MKLNVSGLNGLFSKKEIDLLGDALIRDQYILPAILRILEHKLSKADSPTKYSEFESPAWAYQRAYRDGRSAELRELIEILTKE